MDIQKNIKFALNDLLYAIGQSQYSYYCFDKLKVIMNNIIDENYETIKSYKTIKYDNNLILVTKALIVDKILDYLNNKQNEFFENNEVYDVYMSCYFDRLQLNFIEKMCLENNVKHIYDNIKNNYTELKTKITKKYKHVSLVYNNIKDIINKVKNEYITEYINELSKEYNNSIIEKVKVELNKIKVDNILKDIRVSVEKENINAITKDVKQYINSYMHKGCFDSRFDKIILSYENSLNNKKEIKNNEKN